MIRRDAGRDKGKEMLVDCVDLDALEREAHRVMRPESWVFCDTGADDEITAKENIAAWRALKLRPRMLRDIVDIDTSVTLLGDKVGTPIMVAPTGRHHLFHSEGERATARGSAAAGALYVMSTSGATLVEDVAKERGRAPQWFQLYMQPDREATGALLDRCVKAGFKALVLTADQPVPGWSPRAYRTPVIASESIRSVNMVGQPVARTAYDPERKGVVMFPTNFRDLEWLVKRCAMPVVVKGVLRGDDAKRCVDCGVKGIMVSNHGGRHLDTTVTTAEVIAEVADAVGKQRRGLCRRRHPPRHRHRQGAGAGRAGGAGRPSAAVGPVGQRRRGRPGSDGASARRDGKSDAALRRQQPRGADAGSGEGLAAVIPGRRHKRACARL